jgi:hypothetical protein
MLSADRFDKRRTAIAHRMTGLNAGQVSFLGTHANQRCLKIDLSDCGTENLSRLTGVGTTICIDLDRKSASTGVGDVDSDGWFDTDEVDAAAVMDGGGAS